MPRLIIFDCDGVLIDSEYLGCRVESEVFIEAGFALSAEAIVSQYVGISEPTMLAAIEEHFGKRLPEDISDRLRRRREAVFVRELSPIPGISEVLNTLEIPACVASSSNPGRLRETLGLTGLAGFFPETVFSATMVPHGKPAPDLFLFAAQRMGVDPTDCLVIEDSAPGVIAGVAAGMTVWGFVGGSHCGPGHGATLAAVGAERTFAAMDTLPAMLANGA